MKSGVVDWLILSAVSAMFMIAAPFPQMQGFMAAVLCYCLWRAGRCFAAIREYEPKAKGSAEVTE